MKNRIAKTLLATLLTMSSAYADDAVAKVVQIKEVNKGGGQQLTYIHDGKGPWVGYVDMQGCLHDKFTTDKNTVAALEFLLGGKVGINKDSEIEIVSERSVKDAKLTVKRIILRKGGLWAKAVHIKEPLEIKTNGGVMGIKGTEFVVDTLPDGGNSVSVLEGAVEVSGNDGKVYGTAQPGDKYTIYQDVKVHKAYDKKTYDSPDALRDERQNSQEWHDFNSVLNIAATFLNYVPGPGGYYAYQAVNIVRNPAQALKDRAISEATSRDPSGISGRLSGLGGGSRKPPKPKYPYDISPDGSPDSKTEKTARSAPLFKWSPTDDTDGYVVLVCKDEQFNVIEWSARVKDGQVAYPSNAAPLSKGRHYWRIIPVNDQDKPENGKDAAQTYFDVVP